ncbi:hypothetical protein PWT90_05408 [Aphanocladium album]|nr:hypothetical protein PWT90_05408 [Aphanocladium album]
MSSPHDDDGVVAAATSSSSSGGGGGDVEAAHPTSVHRPPALLYHVQPSDGRLAPLILQSFRDDARSSLPPTEQWQRLGAKPPSPMTTLGKMSYWIAAPLLEPGSAELKTSDKKALGKAALRYVAAWPLGCFLFYGFEFMTASFQMAVETPGLQLALTDSRYQPVRHLGAHETVPQNARAAESSTERRDYRDDIDLDTDLTAAPSDAADDAHTVLVETSDQGTASRPRHLCYIRDPELDEYETINVSQFLDKEGDDVDMEFVFVSYTREQFRVATDEEIDNYTGYPDEATREANRQLAHRDRQILVQWGLDAAKRAGKRAFWIDFECVRDRDGVARTSSKSDDVYRICDVVRAAHSMIIATGPPASEKVAAILAGQDYASEASGQQATTKWLRHWGSRLWTLPELLLCPSEHRVKLYVLGQQQGSEPVALAKRNFAERAWDDAGLVKELVNHYEGSAILSQMQLVETALACFARRGTHQFSPGDIAYALMGLLPNSQRPAVHVGDSGFQAFARLSLANDGGEFLSRMLCLLPPPPPPPPATQTQDEEAAWYDSVKDVWGARIRDVLPTSRVVKVAADSPDTLLLDGAHCAAIRWDAFDADGIRQGEMPPATLLVTVLIWSAGATAGAVGILRAANLLVGHGSIFVDGRTLYGALVFALVLSASALLAPVLYLRAQRRNRRGPIKAQLVGIEGRVDAGVVERHLWGRDSGRLMLVDAAAADPNYRDEEEREEDSDADAAEATQQKPRGKSDFTLVDTHMMTVTHISTRKPPVAAFAVGSVVGAQRMLLCSYDWRDDTFERETVLRVESKMMDQMRRIDQFRLRLRSSPPRTQGAAGEDVEPAAAVVAQDTASRWQQRLLFVYLLYSGGLWMRKVPITAYCTAFMAAQVPAFVVATRMSLQRVVPQLILLRAFSPGIYTFIRSIRVIHSMAGAIDGTLYTLLLALLWSWWWRSPAQLTARALTLRAFSMLFFAFRGALLELAFDRKDGSLRSAAFFVGMVDMLLYAAIVTVGRRVIDRPEEVSWLPASKKLALVHPSSLPQFFLMRNLFDRQASPKKHAIPLVFFAVSLLAHLATDPPLMYPSAAGYSWVLYVYTAIVILFTICVSRFEKSPILLILASALVDTWQLKLEILCLSLMGWAVDCLLKTIGPIMFVWQLQAPAGATAILLLVVLWVHQLRYRGRIAL